MAEISASQAALNAFASSVEYYADGLRRCETRDETKWRDRRDAAQRVVDAIAEYETTLAYWREPHARRPTKGLTMPRPFPHRDSTFPRPDSAYFAPDALRRPPIQTAPDGPSWGAIVALMILTALFCLGFGAWLGAIAASAF